MVERIWSTLYSGQDFIICGFPIMSINQYLKSLIVFGLFIMHSLHVVADIPKGVRQTAKELGVPVENIRSTPAKGLYELLAGTKILYVTEDGQHLLAGYMLDVATKENLTSTRMEGIRQDAISLIADDQYISFKAGKPKHTVTVFTDIDCGYCRKLHAEMGNYNKLGISVNYLFFPRSGPGTASYNKAVSVWCNKDRNAAMTLAKAGKSITTATCNNPVTEHYKLGVKMGVTGTPYIVTERGEVLPGYMPPAALKGELDKL